MIGEHHPRQAEERGGPRDRAEVMRVAHPIEDEERLSVARPLCLGLWAERMGGWRPGGRKDGWFAAARSQRYRRAATCRRYDRAHRCRPGGTVCGCAPARRRTAPRLLARVPRRTDARPARAPP